ncbi:hypothetical protein Tco_1134976 [Tanacetum coccineum]
MTHTHSKRNFVPRAVLMKSGLKTLNTARQNSSRAVVSVNTARLINTAYQRPIVNCARPASNVFNRAHSHGNPQLELQEKRVIDSGCSRHMTGNKSYLSDYEVINGRFVAFGGKPKGGKITGKGKIKIGKLDFKDVYFVKELKFNLFGVSQMCDKKSSVLFTDTECVVLSPGFKLLDESQVLLRVPRKNNMYSVDLKNVIPSGGLTCLFAKAILDESNLWHRRPGHINFKTNKLTPDSPISSSPKRSDDEVADDARKKSTKDPANEGDKDDQDLRDEFEREFERLFVQGKEAKININSTNSISAISSPINTGGTKDADDEPMMPNTGIFGDSYDDEDFFAGGDMNNLESSMYVSPIAITRVHKDHLVEQIIGDLHSAP